MDAKVVGVNILKNTYKIEFEDKSVLEVDNCDSKK